MDITDEVTVMRAGRVVGAVKTARPRRSSWPT
jgi:ABC-type uncharacterized transport system ATPase subunit